MTDTCHAPIRIDRVLDDPASIRRRIEANAPYAPVQRYFEDDAEFRATAGEASRKRAVFIAPVFRGDWAYEQPLIDEVDDLLHHAGFVEAAKTIFSSDCVRPFSVYSNLTWQLPFAQGPGHIDVAEFRGMNRTVYPIWLLTAMNHSRLFEAWRIPIATAVAWFYEGRDGGFDYWPEGPDAPARIHEGEIFNTAIVGDNDRMFHRVRPVGAQEDGIVSGLTQEARLVHRGGDRWGVDDAGGACAEFDFAQLRISLSWKARIFADSADEQRFLDHGDDLGVETMWRIFEDDLAKRGIDATRPADPIRDPAWIALLSSTYVREPTTAPLAA